MTERLESLAGVFDGWTLMPWTVGLETQWTSILLGRKAHSVEAEEALPFV
jgi:hypothetical protein